MPYIGRHGKTRRVSSDDLSALLYSGNYHDVYPPYWLDGREITGEDEEMISQAVTDAWQQIKGGLVKDPWYCTDASYAIKRALVECGAAERADYADEQRYSLVFMACQLCGQRYPNTSNISLEDASLTLEKALFIKLYAVNMGQRRLWRSLTRKASCVFAWRKSARLSYEPSCGTLVCCPRTKWSVRC